MLLDERVLVPAARTLKRWQQLPHRVDAVGGEKGGREYLQYLQAAGFEHHDCMRRIPQPAGQPSMSSESEG